KSNIFKILQQHRKEKVLVVADGAAFGCEMEKIMQLMRLGRRIILYLPESFEWLVLKSGVIEDGEIKAILDDPSSFIDSKIFFSWERFFTNLLIQKSKDTYLHYNKKSLNKAYLQEKVKDKIMGLVLIKE
ncbi:MAG: translation initiation factor 2, partial [Phascolarctobacterium sp.]